MRPHTSGERAAFGGASLAQYERLEIQGPDGEWRDYTDTSQPGGPYFVGAEFTEDIDGAAMSGTLTLRRDTQVGATFYSLSPLREDSLLNRNGSGSYAPAITAGRRFRFAVAVLPAGSARPGAASSDWKWVWEGRIDDVNAAGNPMQVMARSLDAFLLDTMIEERRNYGTPAGVAAETVGQSVLTDNATGVTLYTPVASGFAVTAYTPDNVSVFEGVRQLAFKRGWDARYRYDSAGVSRYTFYGPDRTKTVADATFGPHEWRTLPQFAVSDADVRNVIEVSFRDAATGQRLKVVRQHTGSIALFGRRFMRLVEPDDSPVNTATEATALADAAVAELAFPKATAQIEFRPAMWWPGQLGDLYGFTSNVRFNTTQTYAVVALRHSVGIGVGSTTMTVRGSPAGAYHRWIDMAGGEIPAGALPVGTPLPTFGPLTAEAVSDGGATDPRTGGTYGMAHLRVQWDANTHAVRVFAATSPTTPQSNPPQDNQAESYTIDRPEGDVCKADPWTNYLQIRTESQQYRKVLGYGIGTAGQIGLLYVAEAQAVNTGAAPAAPTALAVSFTGATATVTFTRNQADAEQLISRNGVVVYVVPAGATGVVDAFCTVSGSAVTFTDPGLTTGVKYSYDVQALSATGRTSAVLSLTETSDAAGNPGNASAPAWHSTYPDGETLAGEYFVSLRWTCSDTLATHVVVQVADSASAGGWVELLRSTQRNPATPLQDDSFPRGTVKAFRLTTERSGVPTNLYSATRSARYGG